MNSGNLQTTGDLYIPNTTAHRGDDYYRSEPNEMFGSTYYDLDALQLQQLQAQLQEQNHGQYDDMHQNPQHMNYETYGQSQFATMPVVTSSSSSQQFQAPSIQSPDSSSTLSNDEFVKKTVAKRVSKPASDQSTKKDDTELTEEEFQRRKKMQNRNAQRAFRERKETKLKELEAKLLQSENDRQKMMDELDIIRRQNISILAENEVLKGNSALAFNSQNSMSPPPQPSNERFQFPRSETDFINDMVGGTNHQVKPAYMHKVYDSPDHPGSKTLGIGALWDYLQIKAEEMGLDDGSMDVQMIMQRLRGNERCHGYGPAYPLELVDRVIAECCVFEGN